MYISPEDIAFYGVLLIGITQGARAECYYWYMGHFDKKVSSPSAEFAIFYFTGISRDQGGFLLWSLRQIQVKRARFSIVWIRSGDWVLFNTTVVLKGDRCPEGQSLDLKDGLCKPPPPECESGVPNLFQEF
ncbi:hypothetical protein [Pseudomonas aeruginosa]|uniref:hypothetical protein n=1 Tax=Pseudomonas aeruginosa TaxID=287 RepID=UPI0021B2FE09|nr:hypothetical protein [Pseudomonas aeruginosa]MCT7418566.1 hypothetical protein [Pseudomonas aeruginosa]